MSVTAIRTMLMPDTSPDATIARTRAILPMLRALEPDNEANRRTHPDAIAEQLGRIRLGLPAMRPLT